MCKIAVNLMLAVVNANMAEITLLAEKAGVKRSAFLEFLNNSVMGSTFTRYKSPAFVNLDWAMTFPPTGMRKDMDLGLSIARQLEVPMPVVAATRELLQSHIGMAKGGPEQDFAALFDTLARLAGAEPVSENRQISDGLEPEKA
jgi:3-hydroxyisobutyrate dehydrogenase